MLIYTMNRRPSGVKALSLTFNNWRVFPWRILKNTLI